MSTPTQLGAMFGLVVLSGLLMAASVVFAITAAFCMQGFLFIPSIVCGGFAAFNLHRAGILKELVRPRTEKKRRALEDAFDKFQ